MILRGRRSLDILSTLKEFRLALIGKKAIQEVNTMIKSSTFQGSLKYLTGPCPNPLIIASIVKKTVVI
jgi:hypothetical protein